jgi:hypothetical protein
MPTPVEWTKADDVQYSSGGPPPKLRSTHPGGYEVLIADGTVHFCPGNSPQSVPSHVEGLILRNDGMGEVPTWSR